MEAALVLQYFWSLVAWLENLKVINLGLMWLLDKQLVTWLGVLSEGWKELWLSVGW